MIDEHPHAPREPDPHTVPVVFKWAYGPAERIRVGVSPYRKGKQWFAPVWRCRDIYLCVEEKDLPTPLRSVLDHARTQPNHTELRWFAMLTPEEAETLMKLGREP